MSVTRTHQNLLQALQQAEAHLLLVTQERSVYREALEENRRQTQAHFLLELEGKFVPPPDEAYTQPQRQRGGGEYVGEKEEGGGGGGAEEEGRGEAGEGEGAWYRERKKIRQRNVNTLF